MNFQSDNKPPDHGDTSVVGGMKAAETGAAADTMDMDDEAAWPIPQDQLKNRVTRCYNASTQFLDQSARAEWQRSIRAYRNEHFEGSKYKSPEWSHRSKLFRPKTRSAIRKSMDNAAKALFSSPDVVTVSPGNTADPIQRASAAVKQELLNYRLDRSKGAAAVPWFQIAMGACQDARVHGVCISLQSWKYREVTRLQTVTEVDELTGVETTRQQAVPRTVIDRPDIELYRPEDVLIEPMAHWIKPEQNAQWLFLQKRATIDDVMAMIRRNTDEHPNAAQWLVTDREEIEKLFERVTKTDRAQSDSVRRAREGGQDPSDATQKADSRAWITTCFMTIDGEDYVWWMLNCQEFLSAPALVDDIYPWCFGERPVVWGYGTVDSHRILPMSTASSLAPLQQEANDIVNLRLDQMKQVAHPLTKIVRGRNVDTQALLRRGANTQIFVQDHGDIEFDRPPDVSSSAYAESNYINADFDDLAGNFSTGTVQTNRALNETVGGMKLLANNAASMGEFDTTVWIQTWVEAVLAQTVKLIGFYENDETILTIAGEKAKLIQKFGIDSITDQMLLSEATVTVNVGASAIDPMQRLQKLQTAGAMVGEFLQQEFQSGQVKKNARAIIDEVFGASGYGDGGERFFHFPDDEQAEGGGQKQEQPDPAQMAAAMKAKAEADKIAQETQIAQARAVQEAQIKDAASQADIARKDREAAAEIARKQMVAAANERIEAERANSQHRLAESEAYLQSLRTTRSNEIDIIKRQAEMEMDLNAKAADRRLTEIQRENDIEAQRRLGRQQESERAGEAVDAEREKAETGAQSQAVMGDMLAVIRETLDRNAEIVATATAAMQDAVKAANAPRSITLNRDASGQVSGATATPTNGQAS